MEAATVQSKAAPPPRLRERYEQEVLPALMSRFGYSTTMQAPRLQKIGRASCRERVSECV